MQCAHPITQKYTTIQQPWSIQQLLFILFKIIFVADKLTKEDEHIKL